jgi:hypothetical protein
MTVRRNKKYNTSLSHFQKRRHSFAQKKDKAATKEDEQEFLRIYTSKYQKIGGEAYAIQQNTEQRNLYRNQRLNSVKHRDVKWRTDGNTPRALFPPITTLLAKNVLFLPFNLECAASLALGISSPTKLERLLTVEKGSGGFFGKYIGNAVLTGRYLGRALRKGMCNIHGACDGPVLYKNSTLARRALLWFLACCQSMGNPSLWIARLYREDEFTNLSLGEDITTSLPRF